MFRFVLILSIHLGFSSLGLQAQNSLNEIDLDRIPQKRIREFILDQKRKEIVQFVDVHSSVTDANSSKDLRTHQKSYTLKQEIGQVWNAYVSANPAKSWQGKRVSFGVLFSKISNYIIYSDDNYGGLDSGQVFYINIGLMKGLENLAVAFEVLKVDVANRKIEFSYVDGGKSVGIQTIQFIDMNDGSTQVVHQTLFRSNSPFRDRFLYPYFHTKVINEYHRNMKKLIS